MSLIAINELRRLEQRLMREHTHLVATINSTNEPKMVRVRTLISAEVGAPWDRVTSKSRKRNLVRARWLAMYVFRRLDYSLERIGRIVGNRDHTTVLHGLRRAQETPEIVAVGDEIARSFE